jgi:hypothetical protein
MTQPKYNWFGPTTMMEQVKEIWTQGLSMEALRDEVADIVYAHTQHMHALPGSPMAMAPDEDGVSKETSIPVNSQNKHFWLRLTKYLTGGTYGDVFVGYLEDLRAPRPADVFPQIIKFISASLKYLDKEGKFDPKGLVEATESFLNEMFMQSVLHCAMDTHNPDDSAPLPNPIPPILAPLRWDAPDGSNLYAAVMPNAGTPFYKIMMDPAMTSSRLFLILALLATHLRELQARAQFQHCDLHTGNVMVRIGRPYTTPWGGQTSVHVFLIDFGYACITMDGVTLAAGMDDLEEDDVFGGPCRAKNPATDLFVFLASIVRTSMNELSPRVQPFVDAVKAWVDEAIVDAGLDFPSTDLWDEDDPPTSDLYMWSPDIRMTTPALIMSLCLPHIQSELKPAPSWPVHLVPRQRKPSRFGP